MTPLKPIRQRMIHGWRNGLPETPCGLGSTLEYTEDIRIGIGGLIKRLNIRSINDIGAGDLNWILESGWPVDYKAYDIVQRHESVEQLDITTQTPRDCDLTLCRDVLIHLTNDEAYQALRNIWASSAYMLVTTYDVPANCELTRVYRKMNLELPPYDLGAPIISILERTEGKKLGLWDGAIMPGKAGGPR